MAEQTSRQFTIETVLRGLMEHGGFEAAVVATSDGLPIALVGQSTVDTRLVGAVAASMKDLATRAHQELDEISLRDKKGKLVVSRYFSIVSPQGQFNLLLAVQVPERTSYRRLVNQAVKRIQQVWSD
jgi:predicted regulator of Ras-like GTPase activity (Roadblock/LC7/MglB family)